MENLLKEKLIEKYKILFKGCVDDDSTESAHCTADVILVELLDELGFRELTIIYDEVDKWYS